VNISRATFATAFQRLERAVDVYTGSKHPFNFQPGGLAYEWEHYKEWVYYEAQRRLDVASWKRSAVGSGQILERTIRAIEIHQDKNFRNNIVAWDGRRGEEAKSHRKMIVAKETPSIRSAAEAALFRMYAEDSDPEECFTELAELFGARYDLISYLFFVRNWQEFLPVKSSFFPRAFEELGVPHEMSMRCNWENYAGFLSRMRGVQELLASYELPGGVRFIDAHSFCWMLASENLSVEATQRGAILVRLAPEAGVFTPATLTLDAALTQEELDLQLLQQRRIGDLAVSIVLRSERKRLAADGRPDLASRVQDVSANVLLGYDIASFTNEGAARPVEVKAAAKRGDDLRFFVSEGERVQSRTMPNYTFALVTGVESSRPTILEFAGTDLSPEALRPVAYEARLRTTRAPA